MGVVERRYELNSGALDYTHEAGVHFLLSLSGSFARGQEVIHFRRKLIRSCAWPAASVKHVACGEVLGFELAAGE